METNKYNRRKVKNYLDRHAISVYLNVFTKVSDIILTTKQLNVLGIMIFHGYKNKMCISDLGNYLKVKNHSSLSRLTKSLETKGLINKKLDGKKVYLSLSKKGKNYLDRLYSIFNRQHEGKNFHTSEKEDLIYVISEGYKEKKIAIS
tara:strand:+ start:339 stop:779 length:441 start_codon:yes stop_codon:yes gene_type:complete